MQHHVYVSIAIITLVFLTAMPLVNSDLPAFRPDRNRMLIVPIEFNDVEFTDFVSQYNFQYASNH